MNNFESGRGEASAIPNLFSEQLISFSQAAKMFPSYRLGRPVGPSCIWRWFRQGVRTENKQLIHLEAIRVVGRHLTSVEAVRRFIAAQQQKGSSSSDSGEKSTLPRPATRRDRDSEDSLRQLNHLRRSNRSKKGNSRIELVDHGSSFESEAKQLDEEDMK